MMVRLLLRLLVFLSTAALGLLAASLLLDDVVLSLPGFLTATVVFAIAQSILAPFILSMTRKHAPTLLGGVGLISALAALVVAALFPGGLQISGVATWVLAALIVWLVTALGAWLLPLLILKDKAESKHRAGSAA